MNAVDPRIDPPIQPGEEGADHGATASGWDAEASSPAGRLRQRREARTRTTASRSAADTDQYNDMTASSCFAGVPSDKTVAIRDCMSEISDRVEEISVMVGFVTECPHCRAHIALEVVRAISLPNEIKTLMFMFCPKCFHPTSAEVTDSPQGNIVYIYSQGGNTVINKSVKNVIKTYPSADNPVAPSNVPAAASRVYLQARESHQRKALDLAAMGYRKTLEVALKDYDPDVTGMLNARIKAIAEKKALPPALIDWAHLVKQLGNEGAHDLPEPTEEDVDDLFLFTESLLEYLFTMPTKLAERKAQHHGAKNGN